MSTDIHQILSQYWGFSNFRPLQEDIIRAVLNGSDTLALLPTGGGKSLCFQVPTLAVEGMAVVVSPLIALMKDQVQNLRRLGIAAEAIYTGMPWREVERILNNCLYGTVKFLYVSPERLKTEMFIERFKQMNINLLAIDEAHCISQWGYDFRPAYLHIAEIRQYHPTVPLLALTATATQRVRADIQEKLSFRPTNLLFKKSFKRDNLSYSVFFEENKLTKVADILRRVPGCAIVYVRSRKKTEETANYLQKQGLKADFYHAGLDSATRSRKQDAWKNDQTPIIVCTNAFGMGIDKPNVRVVVHLDLPDSLEAYYQEAGRAGRDEKKAYAVLLYNQSDVQFLEESTTQRFPEPAVIRRTYQALGNYCKLAVGAGEGQCFDFDLQQFCKSYQLPTATTHHALKILEQNEYLLLSEAVHQASKLSFLVDREGLYHFEVANSRCVPYIKAILRNYGGVFNQYVEISENQLATQTHTQVQQVKNALKFMHQCGLMDYVAAVDNPQITFLRERLPEDHLHLDHEMLYFRKQVANDNWRTVVDYAMNTTICRTQQLVRYFNELNSTDCGVCDLCLERKKRGRSEQEAVALQQFILQTVQTEPLTTDHLIKRLSKFKQESVIAQVRWLLDQEALGMDGERRLRRL